MNKIFKPCNILLPNAYADIEKWAVIACDQYTSEENYWHRLTSFIDGEPSTLDLIIPEAFINKMEISKKIKSINANMDKLLKSNFFSEYKKSFIFTERFNESGEKTLGLVGKIDLEEYDFNINKNAKIRATEATVEDRLPIRCAIRKNASLELSHVVLLINDEKKEILEEIEKIKYSLRKLYDFELNMNGGYIKGYLINDYSLINDINAKLSKLEENRILALVGDGNHSLASAKLHWEELKKNLSEEKKENHPARYALVEIKNLYDDGLHFEAIHRIIYNANDDFYDKLKHELKGNFETCVYIGNKIKKISMNDNAILAIKQLQEFIDAYIKDNKDVYVDYIHGEENLKTICENNNATGIVLPKLKKEEFFAYVSKYHVMPKKTFSIGEANEKRYYIETRKIK